jgi:hypothetical protein
MEDSKSEAFSARRTQVEAVTGAMLGEQASAERSYLKWPCARQWQILNRRVGSYFDRWEIREPRPMNPVFAEEAIGTVSDAFDQMR